MSNTVVVIPFATIPKSDGWPPEGDQWRALDGSIGIYPTLAQLKAVIRSLNPARIDESFGSDAHPAPRWYCDVQFGPVEHRPGGHASYTGGGFELNCQVVDDSDGVPVHSLGFRGVTADWVFALCQPLVAACGPLVAVDGGCGHYALLTEHSELGSFRATLDCHDVSPST
jgi:hypothetical protein